MESIETALRSNVEQLKADVRAEVASNADRFIAVIEGQDAKFDGLTNQLEAQASALEDLKAHLTDRLSSIETALQALSKQVVRPMPVLGQDEYLGLRCPVPAGSAWNQDEYVLRLEGAAWAYIAKLGNPIDGVDGDQEAFEYVISLFPGLDTNDIITALKHVHTRLWHYPFEPR